MAGRQDLMKAKRIKDAYTKVVNDNVDNLNDWLLDIATNNKPKAVELLTKLTEYVLPKLNRDEIMMIEEVKEYDYSKLTDDELKLLTDLMEKCRITS